MFHFRKGIHTNKEEKENQPVEMEPAPDVAPIDCHQTESQTIENAVFLESFHLPEMKDDLLRLWRRWAGDRLPPILSLASGIAPENLPERFSVVEREKLQIAVKLGRDAKNRIAEIQALERKDSEVELPAECCCYVSEDRIAAWLFVFPPVGKGEGLSSETLGKALEKSDVKNGIDTKRVIEILKNPPYFELTSIAFGTPPVQGRDGAVIEKFPHEVVQEILVDENGNADYRSVSYVQNVEKGQMICEIELPVPGTDGMGVDGKVVPAAAVTPAKVPQGRNTQLSEDGLHLFASQSGHLEYVNGAFRVHPVLEIATDVDYSTGNIDFVGDVHIHGDVRENFKVQAKGTIMIDGLVEAATIEAGGDLLISSGVVGDNRAVLRSAGNVRAKYLESCQVYAGRSVYADCVVASQICCDGSVIVTSGRGSIIGGNLIAGESVRAKMIGARSGRQTEITLGEFPYTEEELKTIETEITQTQSEKESLETKILDMERCEVVGERIAKAKIKKVALDVKLGKLEKQKSKQSERKPDLAQCSIVCEAIYPITKIEIGQYAGYIDNVRYQYKVRYGDDITGAGRDII